MFFHTARYHIAGSQLRLFRFVVRHETVLATVEQQASISATTLRDQDASGKDTGGMKLYGFHIAQGGDTGFQGDGGTHSLVDNGVGGDPVDTTETASGDAGGFRHVRQQFTGHQVAHDGTTAAPAVVNQGYRFHPLVHRDIGGNGLVAHGIEHGVAGAVGDIAGAPLLRAAEIAAGDQAVGLICSR